MTKVHTDAEASASGGSIAVVCRDVFFLVTVRNTLIRMGYAPLVVKSAIELLQAERHAPLVLVIADMAAVTSPEEWTILRELDGDVPILAFGPHKDVDAFRSAKAGGVTRVVANSQFHREMADLVTRYARPLDSTLETNG